MLVNSPKRIRVSPPGAAGGASEVRRPAPLAAIGRALRYYAGRGRATRSRRRFLYILRMPNSGASPKLEIVTEVPDRALVVFAHPDDAELGAGGVVACWAAKGCEVTYVLCTNGSAGTADRALSPVQLAEKRAAEQRAAADFMGVTNVVMLEYPDGGLADTRELLGDVVRAIRRYKPHTVLTHDPYRIKGFQHRDHRAAGMAST